MKTVTRKLLAPSHVKAILHLDAGHDVNGNPRRGYLAIGRDGSPIGYIDEGYRGPDAMRDLIRDYETWSRMTRHENPETGEVTYGNRRLPYPVQIATTPTELREWRGKDWGNA